MAESILEAEVDIQTLAAFRNLQNLLQASDQASAAVDRLSKAVDDTDKKHAELAERAKQLEQQFKATGSEADKLDFQETKAAADTVKEKSENLRRSLHELQSELTETAKAQVKTADESVKANEKTAAAAKQSGGEVEKASKSASMSVGGIGQEADKASLALLSMSGAAAAMVAGFAGLTEVVEILKQLEQAAKDAIKAREELGKGALTFDQQIQGIISRLGLQPGPQGESRARALVAGVQRRAPEVSPQLAADLLARAQTTGFEVARPDQPRLDDKLAGSAMAAEVGRFATRTQLDRSTAAELFNVAQTNGVRTLADMRSMLALFSQELRKIPLAGPDAANVAVRIVTERAAQGIPMQQTLASLAAVASAEPSPTRAGSNLERFTRAAMGSGDQQKLLLAQLAQQRGLITPQGLAAAQAGLPPPIESQQAIEHITQLQQQLEQSQLKEVAIQRDEQEKQKRLGFTLTQLSDRMRKVTKPEERVKIAEEQRRTNQEIGKLTEDSARGLAEREQRRGNLQTQIDDSTKRLGDQQKKDADKMRDMALREAYAQLPVAQREQLLFDVTRGMTQEQLTAFVTKIAEARTAQGLIRQLGPQGQAAYTQAMGMRPDVPGYLKRTGAFESTAVGGDIAQRQATETAAAMGAPAGQEFADVALAAARKDIVYLQSVGSGRIGAHAVVPYERATVEAMYTERGRDVEELEARRLMVVVRLQLTQFLQTISPAHYARRSGRIQEIWNKFTTAYKQITEDKGGHYLVNIGARKLQDAQAIAAEVGAFIDLMNSEALQLGEAPGKTTLLEQPGQMGPETLTVPGSAPPAPSGGAAGPAAATPGSGASLGPAGVPIVPQTGSNASGGGSGGPVTYNLTVGTVVSGVLDRLEDLPSRIGAPDLA
jgi:hypothetical protein